MTNQLSLQQAAPLYIIFNNKENGTRDYPSNSKTTA